MSALSSRLPAMVVALMVCAGIAGCDTGAVPSSGAVPQGGDAAPMAPDYSARRLNGTETVSLRDLRGKPVLLTSWATWCTECRTELPVVQRLAETYRDQGLQVIGVNVDEGGDAGPIAFAAQRGLSSPMAHDEHTRYQAAFRAVGVPQTELISADGRLLKVWQGVFDPADPANTTLRVLTGSVLFVLGVAVVFVLLGAAFGSLGDLLRHHQDLLTRIFGALTILLGLAASTHGATAYRGAGLAFIYCLGLGIPFIVTGLALHRAMAAFVVVKRHYRALMIVGGGCS